MRGGGIMATHIEHELIYTVLKVFSECVGIEEIPQKDPHPLDE